MEMNNAPESWIKQIETSILQSKEVPMWGIFPGFPWKEFSKHFAEIFGFKKFKITPKTAEWKKGNVILAGMGDSPLQLGIEMTPLNGSVSLIFPSEDFAKFSSWALYPSAQGEGFSDPYLQKGFFRYAALEAVHAIDQMHIFKGLAPKLIDMPLSREDGYAIDFSVEKDGETIWGRLVCPPFFQEAFKAYYAGEWQLSAPSHLYEAIDLDLSLSAGRTTIGQEEWKTLKEGDLVFLDHCSYSPNSKRGTFQLGYNQTPLFQVKLKDENIKILDYALYYEDTKMSDEYFDETMNEEFSEEEAHRPIPEAGRSAEEMISPKKVPISLTVEVAKMKLSLDKLLKLKPGNVLELSVSPEQGVRLVANGKCMAYGDLVQIGDVLGIKITKIGS